MRALDRRDYSEGELADYLQGKGVSEQLAAEVISRLVEIGLIDDARFAMRWANVRHQAHRAPRVIAQELQRKQISPELIEEALSQISSSDEWDSAREFASSKAAKYRNLPSVQAVNRLAGALARRGFSPRICFEVAKETLASDAEFFFTE